MGYNPQESLENSRNTMGTLSGVHPIVPWKTVLFDEVKHMNAYISIAWI